MKEDIIQKKAARCSLSGTRGSVSPGIVKKILAAATRRCSVEK
jgi:hypothetical protein